MKVALCEEFPHLEGWYCEVQLNRKEWPSLETGDNWLERPIRLWVLENCPDAFFHIYGAILFRTEEDLVQFQLVWG